MKEKEHDAERIVKALDHPVRRRIIELLGNKGALHWKELATELGSGTGALYYHLDALEGLVYRDSSKRYALTKLGQDVYSHLQRNPITAIQSLPTKLGSHGSLKSYIQGFFAPRSIIDTLTSTHLRSIITTIILSSITVLILYWQNYSTKLFFFFRSSDIVIISISYVGSLITLLFICYIASLFIFKVKPGLIQLLASCSLSFIPIILFILGINVTPGVIGLLSNRSLSTLILVFFQAWSATILSAGVSVSSGTRIEKAVVIGLIILYATMLIMLLT